MRECEDKRKQTSNQRNDIYMRAKGEAAGGAVSGLSALS